MRILALFIIQALLLIFLASPLPAEGDIPPVHEIIASRCVQCHADDGEGGVNLDGMTSEGGLGSQPELLERVLKVLRDRRMPPESEEALADESRQNMLAKLDAIRVQTLQNQGFLPIPIRRMNRFQYNNAVVDLLELDRDIFQLNERLLRRREDYFRPATKQMPDRVRVSSRPLSKDIDNQRPEGFRGVSAFPQDQRAEHGFDNRADHLSLSPLLMESFLKLSQTIVQSPDLNSKECRSWDRLFVTAHNTRSESNVIRERLAKLMRRAFRRPAETETLDRFVQFAEARLRSGAAFEETMRTVVGAILAMPEFLYLHEELGTDIDGEHPGRARVDDYELASRLAQFIWSSIPDDVLLDLAEAGTLSQPAVLSTQIDRMLNDQRSGRFCDNFPGQWLQLDRLITAIPDRQEFPYFYYNGYRTSMHMISEPLLLFETIYVEDRPILELIDPGFTWQSAMLSANYEGRRDRKIEVQVQVFHRVPLDDRRRGGVITNAATMTMTSAPARTKPITRGAWIGEVIFNDPPEPPPADVPPLPESDNQELEKRTIRERLAAHRERSDCAGCHNKIDPLGFALENYGPTGVWRDEYDNGRIVDASGVLFNQFEFETVIQFKDLILREKQRFIRGFVAHLLSYGLGRALGPADWLTLDEITAKALDGQDSMRAVLKNVAMSEPFLHKATLASKVALNSNETN